MPARALANAVASVPVGAPVWAFVCAFAYAAPGTAQRPLATYADAIELRVSRAQADVHYTLRLGPPDSLGIGVEMTVRNAPDRLRLAIPVWGPGSYRYGGFYRYVRHVAVTVNGRPVAVTRADSTHWTARLGTGADTAHGRGHEAVVRYRVQWPTAEAARGLNNYSFVRADGALIHGPTTYLYVVGQTLAPARVTVDVPPDWRVATGLTPTHAPRDFSAPSYDILIDSPILTGHLAQWSFAVDNVPHQISYYLTRAARFDTTAFVAFHRRVVEAARDKLGRLPYREYHFLYEDGPGGGLEHLSSTTIGAASERLDANPLAFAGLIAHEYVHAWNVKRARPVALGPFDWQHAPRVGELYWAEGVTDFLSDELLRHAGIDTEQTAVETFRQLVSDYLNNPGRSRVSPERASRDAEWRGGYLEGGYTVSYYLTGSLIGDVIDLTLRDHTNGARGLDDVERVLIDEFGGVRGYTRAGLIGAGNRVCGCDLRPFFDRYVARATPLDLRAAAKLAGWRLDTVRIRARDERGHRPDVRASVTRFGGIGSLGGPVGGRARLQLPSPEVAFARAGLRSGDYLRTVNGRPIPDNAALQAVLGAVRIGDTIRVEYTTRRGIPKTASWVAGGYDVLVVTLTDLPSITRRQRAVRAAWLLGRQGGSTE